MASQLSLTQTWLRQNVQPYTRSDLVYNHVDAVLAAFPTLRPKTEVYTFDDGRSQLLLSIHGLLPISFRRASYNIPIVAWLTLEYPAKPPLVYVVPTSDMLVKAGKFVDVSGRCEPSYIQAWQKKSEGCNLTSLMEALAEQFSKDPPVYAKPNSRSPAPRTRERASSPRTPDYSNRPPPPAPESPQSNGYRPSPPSLAPALPGLPLNTDPRDRPSTRSPPPPPPPPIARHSHPPSQNSYRPPRPATSTSVLDPPRYNTSPAHDHAQTAPSVHFRGPPVNLPSPAQDSSRGGVHTDSTPPLHQRWSIAPAGVRMQYAGQSAPLLPSTLHPQIPLQPPLLAPALLPPQPAPPPQLVTPPVAPTPVHNFLEEDEAVLQPAPPPTNAPPRPPNPEVLRLHAQVHAKFTSELAAFEQAVTADTKRLRVAQSDLLAGEPAIRDEMARLEAVRDVCTVVANRLSTTVQSAEANLVELRRKGDPEVDELICSTTIVYNQLIDLVAEDNAIEDTIYHLHRALNAGRIDLDKFLRTSRTLAEEQFMKRALAQKIVASIPLGAWR